MSLFRFSSPTNDFQAIDTAESINLRLSLEQITHKKIFLEEHIPSKSKIILIGHSIGAYIILHLLKNCSRATDVTKSILLFPTIERMAISPSGRYVTPMVTYFKWFAISAVTAFSCLPEFVKKRTCPVVVEQQEEFNAELGGLGAQASYSTVCKWLLENGA